MALTLVGGTGNLGLEMAKGLVTATGFTAKRALVRSSSLDAPQALQLQALGWTLVHVPDFDDAAALQEALTGTKTVVSTLGGANLVALETATLTAAQQVGVTLYVPSQFGVDYRRWGTSFPFLAGKKQVLDQAQALGMPTLTVFCGFFSDWIFGFLADPSNAKGRLIGDDSAAQKLSFTRRSDIGFVLAKALDDPALARGGTLSMQGDTKTLKEAMDLLQRVMGQKFDMEVIPDPLVALKQEQEMLQKGLKGDTASFYGAFALHLLGEPARGNAGCDVSAEAQTYGVELETLQETLTKVYGSNDK